MALTKDLTREKVLDSALAILRTDGLAALSMRRLATTLDVAPSALYWHIPSKQDLLAALAELILAGAYARTATDLPATDLPVGARSELIATLALRIRSALLAVRDGAEVVSFARALRPDPSLITEALHQTLRPNWPEPIANWGARTLSAYILGQVAEEQNHAELVRAGLLSDDGGARYSADIFLFGVRAIVAGLPVAKQPQ